MEDNKNVTSEKLEEQLGGLRRKLVRFKSQKLLSIPMPNPVKFKDIVSEHDKLVSKFNSYQENDCLKKKLLSENISTFDNEVTKYKLTNTEQNLWKDRVSIIEPRRTTKIKEPEVIETSNTTKKDDGETDVEPDNEHNNNENTLLATHDNNDLSTNNLADDQAPVRIGLHPSSNYLTPSTKKRLAFAALFVPLIYFEAANTYNVRENTWEFIQSNPLLFAVLVGMSLAVIYAIDKKYLEPERKPKNSCADFLADHKKPALISAGILLAGATGILIYFEVTTPDLPSKTLEFMQNNMPLLVGLTALALIKLTLHYRTSKNNEYQLLPPLEHSDSSSSIPPPLATENPNLLKEQIPWLLGLGIAITANLAYQNSETTAELFNKAMQSLAITIPVLVVGMLVIGGGAWGLYRRENLPTIESEHSATPQ